MTKRFAVGMHMESSPFFAYSFLNPIYHENIYSYVPSDEFLQSVRAVLDSEWLIRDRGFWASCSPPGREDLEHGWKIHLSSTQENALETLKIVANIASSSRFAFKFCADRRMLKMSLGKGWSRFQIGKFIAVYPKDVDEFRTIIDELHTATSHLQGPYILTDRPYRDSKVVYYRYGVHRGKPKVDATGRNVSGFALPDGTWYNDVRGPSFRLPPGIEDPLVEVRHDVSKPSSTVATESRQKTVLLKDRYLVQGAVKFNATGGIYRGIDTRTKTEVIIREVRGKLGHLERENPDDPAFILKREARILEKLSDTGLVPTYIDLFKAWDHWFLVIEKLDAISLWGHSMEFYFSNEYQSVGFGLDRILSSIREIGRGLQVIHKKGVVLRDLTKNNILFTKSSNTIKFIDFEFAFETEDAGPWVQGWTPGYASNEQTLARKPKVEDDFYAFGVLILDMLTFSAAGLELSRESIFNKLRLVLNDLGLPPSLLTLISGLMATDASQRWDIAQALTFLDSTQVSIAKRTMFPSRDEFLDRGAPESDLISQIKKVNSGIQAFLATTLDTSRDDRLWPAAPEVFTTHPASLEYGAAGVVMYLTATRAPVSPKVLDWIECRVESKLCPPGLYSGMSGIAVILLQAGRLSAARIMMEKSLASDLTFSRPGLYYGCAGVGLACLHFWLHTHESTYLKRATEIGEWLVKHVDVSERGVSWHTSEKVYLGVGEGQSGVALFLIYLAVATKSERFSQVAEAALNFDISFATRMAGRIVWKVHKDSKEHAPNLPHHKYGSAGIGAVCLRYYALTGESRFKDVAMDCAYTVSTRMSNKIWQDEGSAGYGEFLLDMAEFLEEPSFRNIAYFQAEAILTHAVRGPDGLAFGGVDHYRICSDYSYGSAGIGLFFDRLIHDKPRHLLLDSLLLKERRSAANEAAHTTIPASANKLPTQPGEVHP